MTTKEISPQINFLDGANYELAIARLPMTAFTIQEATLPTVYIPAIEQGNPFIKLKFASTNIEFSEFQVTFKVDENFKNYIELFNWIKGLGFPESHTQYKDLVENRNNLGGIRSDASLVISNSSKIVHKVIRFREAFPTQLSDLSFTTMMEGRPSYITARASFSIRDFEFEDIIA